jgi:hypothetical protein
MKNIYIKATCIINGKAYNSYNIGVSDDEILKRDIEISERSTIRNLLYKIRKEKIY